MAQHIFLSGRPLVGNPGRVGPGPAPEPQSVRINKAASARESLPLWKAPDRAPDRGEPARTAWETIEAEARELISKRGYTLSKAQAVEEVVRANPGLYARYRAEGVETARPPEPPAPAVSATWQAIEAAAQTLIAKSPVRLTKAQAVVKLLEANPALYTQYRQDITGR